MSKPWMPLYVADYLSDTGHLTTVQHGAYLLLIMHYWKRGGLPSDDTQLAQIARMTEREWARNKVTIGLFFSDEWQHERINQELAHAEEISSKRRIAGSQKRSNSEAIAEQLPTQSPSQSPSKEKKDSGAVAPTPKARSKKRATSIPEGFIGSPDAVTKAGLSVVEGARERERFRNHAHQTGRTCVDWQAAWSNWCIKAAEFMGRAPPSEPGPSGNVHGFYAAFGRPELEIWDRTKPGGYPRDKAGGWRFPSQFPPGYKQEAA
jgi:uncharacterized protein YdaU (DUF1376 family)